MYKFSNVFEFQKKSKIRAGEGRLEGQYPFYTSSAELSKYVDNALFNEEGLVFGTGGNASVHFAEGKFSVSTDCLVAKPKTDNINPKFVYHYLSGNIRILEEGFRGAGLKHVSKTYISDIKLPEIPRARQDKIVSILDQAKSLRQKRKEQLVLLDDYLKSVFLDMFGNPVMNNKKWRMMKFNKVGALDRGVSKHRPRNAPELLGGSYPLIQTGDVSNSDGYITSYKTTYSEVGLKQSKIWPIGTLCITIAANIAKTGILTFKACFPDSVVGFTPNNFVRTEYVQWWLSFLQKTLEEKAPESAQKNINLGILRGLDIPAPPIEDQNKFVELINKAEQTKQKMYASLDEMDNYFNALMQRYFEKK